MLTEQQNARLTQVGKGTPGGELLRRYWWPVACSGAVEPEAVVPVRLLGEDLALYRTESGKLGLVGDRCAHRGVSLVYGIPEEGGIRCSYHGWRYDATGKCTDMPGEPPEANVPEPHLHPGVPGRRTRRADLRLSRTPTGAAAAALGRAGANRSQA